MPRVESSVARGFLEKEQTAISTMALAISLLPHAEDMASVGGIVFALLLKDI